ncbi:MAG: hypothetical protein ABSH31_05445 [Bryobacteraceae bacterium]|jgi:hypothetical protein
MKSIHLPLPDQRLARKRTARKTSHHGYADKMAGTQLDLDPQLEAACLELLFKTEARKVRPGNEGRCRVAPNY